jgi:hypothetical protein
VQVFGVGAIKRALAIGHHHREALFDQPAHRLGIGRLAMGRFKRFGGVRHRCLHLFGHALVKAYQTCPFSGFPINQIQW